MAETKHHSGFMLLGTNAERIAYTTTGLREGVQWIESDTGNTFTWNGTTWLGLATRVIKTTRAAAIYTALVTDDAIFCDTDGGAWTLTLPAGVDGQKFMITNCGSSDNDLTVDGNGAEEINGSVTMTLVDGDSIIIVFETTEEWRIF